MGVSYRLCNCWRS